MKHTIDYSGMNDTAKHAKALADCRSYLGVKYTQIMKILRQQTKEGVAGDIMLIQLSFIGIEGYPAQAMIDEADWIEDELAERRYVAAAERDRAAAEDGY